MHSVKSCIVSGFADLLVLALTPSLMHPPLPPAPVPQMLPLLYEHFRQEGVTSEMFLMDWMMSLFTKVGGPQFAASTVL